MLFGRVDLYTERCTLSLLYAALTGGDAGVSAFRLQRARTGFMGTDLNAAQLSAISSEKLRRKAGWGTIRIPDNAPLR